MLLVTARAPPIGSDVEQIKAVTKTATSAGETNKADDSFKKRAEKFFSRKRSWKLFHPCTLISALADSPFVKGNLFASQKKSSEESAREPKQCLDRYRTPLQGRMHTESSIFCSLLGVSLDTPWLAQAGGIFYSCHAKECTKRGQHFWPLDHCKCSWFATGCDRLGGAIILARPKPLLYWRC